jgi:hypothetical protein
MLHITDGESVAGTLRKSALTGIVSTYGDLMFEGPAPAGLDAEAWRDVRARFIADSDNAGLEEARQYLQGCENTLAAFSQHEEVVIWLDHRLSNQLILIKVLDWFSRQDLGGVQVSLVRVERYSGPDDFLGLGALPADQLESLAGTRVPVSDAQYRAARAAWSAFTSPDPTEIERFIATDTSALPFIAAALRRHLEQFPSVDGGLSRTERQTLSVLRDQGSISGMRLFVAVQRMEEAVFMGDATLYRLAADLSNVRHPLVHISDTPANRLGNVTITDSGRDVLEGRADHIDLNGVDRWLGGVHLYGDKAEWRWDRVAERLVNG